MQQNILQMASTDKARLGLYPPEEHNGCWGSEAQQILSGLGACLALQLHCSKSHHPGIRYTNSTRIHDSTTNTQINKPCLRGSQECTWKGQYSRLPPVPLPESYAKSPIELGKKTKFGRLHFTCIFFPLVLSTSNNRASLIKLSTITVCTTLYQYYYVSHYSSYSHSTYYTQAIKSYQSCTTEYTTNCNYAANLYAGVICSNSK